jgi:hypothetical protein
MFTAVTCIGTVTLILVFLGLVAIYVGGLT